MDQTLKYFSHKAPFIAREVVDGVKGENPTPIQLSYNYYVICEGNGGIREDDIQQKAREV